MLSERQARFVEEYAVDLNATAAYKRAGYKATGRAAENAASRLLGNVGVSKAIKAARAAQTKRSELTADWVISRLRLEVDEGGRAAVRALELIGRHLGMWPREVKHTHEGEVRLNVREVLVARSASPSPSIAAAIAKSAARAT